jgi:hypothetical protein
MDSKFAQTRPLGQVARVSALACGGRHAFCEYILLAVSVWAALTGGGVVGGNVGKQDEALLLASLFCFFFLLDSVSYGFCW